MHSHDPQSELVHRLVQLQRIPLFAQLPPTVLFGLAEHAHETPLRAGEPVASRLPASMCLFPSGADSAFSKRGAGGFTAHLPELVPWLAGAALASDIRARVDAPALQVPTAQLSAALDDEFGLYLAIARAMAAEIVAMRTNALSMGKQPAVQTPPRTRHDLFDRVLLLRAMLPFARTHVGALVHLARHAAELRADPGHVLWREGDAADHALFVVRGSVRARVDGEVLLGPGSVVGGFDALAGTTRWFTAVAEGRLQALVLHGERFFDVLEDQHELARDLLGDLARALLAVWNGAEA